MTISASDVKNIAHLARLAEEEDRIPTLTQNLVNILNLVEEMNQVDTSQVAPMAHPLDATQPLRDDVVSEHNNRDVLLKNAPAADAGLFIVPQFVETE